MKTVQLSSYRLLIGRSKSSGQVMQVRKIATQRWVSVGRRSLQPVRQRKAKSTKTSSTRQPFAFTVNFNQTLTDNRWMILAKCRGAGELFFRHECSDKCRRRKNGCLADEDVLKCKAACLTCPVVIQCRTWAVMTGLQHGIAGGLTKYERTQLRRKLRAEGVQLVYPSPRRMKSGWDDLGAA